MRKLFISLLLFLTFFMLGCNGGNAELDGLNDIEYKIVRQRLDFEKNQKVDMNFEVESATDKALVMLSDAHVKIMFKINLGEKTKKEIKSLLHIRQKATKHIVIDKLLVEKKDYFFDSVNQAVYVAMSVPYIYMLDNRLKVDLEIVGISRKRILKTRNLTLYFEMKPMKENSKRYLSFEYLKSFDDENVDEMTQSIIAKELMQTNKKHLQKEYVLKHKKLLQR